ncbi:MAG: ABC-2 family transporter protein [Chloroflexota bacterium]
MRSFTKYFAVFRINLLQQLAYNGESVARSLSMALFMVVFTALWSTAYGVSGRSDLAGFTLPAIIWYLAMTETLMLARARSCVDIGDEVKSGSIAYALNKPYSYPLFKWADTLGTSLVRFAINFVVGVVVVLFLTRSIEGSGAGLLGFVVLGLLSLVLDAGISVLIGLCAFALEEVRPVDWMYQKLVFTIGGMFIPLDAFPDWLRAIADALPFKYLVYAPARTFVRFDAQFFLESLGGVTLYIALVGAALWVLYARGAKRLAVNGG